MPIVRGTASRPAPLPENPQAFTPSRNVIVRFYQGRMSRLPFSLRIIGANFLLGLLFIPIPFIISSSLQPLSKIALSVITLSVPLLAYFAITLMLFIRRLHDRGHSGWWGGALFLLPLLPLGGGMLSLALSALASIISFFAFLYLLFFKGTAGPNKYGPDPLEKK